MNKQTVDKWSRAIIAACFIVATLAVCLHSPQSKADNPNKARPEAIVLQFRTVMGPFTTNQYGGSREVIGLAVEWSSPSSTAPQIPVGYPAGETFAYLAGHGFVWRQIGVNQFVFEK